MDLGEKIRQVAVFTFAVIALLVLVPFVILFSATVILWYAPRITVGIALGLLLITAIALAVGGESVAKQLAVYAYFFFASGVILLLIRHVKERSHNQ